jgi:pimeloyl-ACP methyl ester carboxylesterase
MWPSTASGRPHAPVVLALHGWTDGGLVYETLAGGLDHRWTVIAPDAPGHGLTPWVPSRTYSLAEAVDDVMQVVDAMDLLIGERSPVVLLGHSMGALTRWRAAGGRQRLRTALANLQALDVAQRVEWVRRANPHWDPAEFVPWAHTKVELDLAHIAVAVDWGPPLATLLEHVTVPVTLVCGAKSRGSVVTARDVDRYRAAYDGELDVQRIAAGHNVRRDNPSVFNAIMRDLLERAESGL